MELQFPFAELIDLGRNVIDSSFEMAEVDALLLEDEDATDAEGAEEAAAPTGLAVSRSGDVWNLGAHRVANSDPRDRERRAPSMPPGEVARIVLTDEPYNFPNTGYVTGNADHREFAMAHGEMTHEELARFNRAGIDNVLRRLALGGLLACFVD